MRIVCWLAALPFTVAFLTAPTALAQGKIRGQDRAPEVGAEAPEFDLERLVDGKPSATQRVQLSAFRGKQPVALVFASWT